MEDFTRAEIEAVVASPWSYASEDISTTITQLLRQLDDMPSRADAAAGKMRERCASLCDDDDPDIWLYHTGNRARYGESKLGKFIRALPLHEELTI